MEHQVASKRRGRLSEILYEAIIPILDKLFEVYFPIRLNCKSLKAKGGDRPKRPKLQWVVGPA